MSDLAAHPGLTSAWLGGAFLAFFWLVVRSDDFERSLPWRAIILAGALWMRLPLLPLPLSLSEDALRYLWDGRIAAAGFNPYLLTPEAPELRPLRTGIWRDIPHGEVPSIYPPLAIAAFAAAARFPDPVFAWKGLVTAVDLAGCFFLLKLCRQLGLPEARVLLYAWNPLVALEVAGMGHVDPLGVSFALAVAVLLGSGAASGRRLGLAAAGAVAGALAKLAPLAALPLWARHSGRPSRFLGVALLLLAAAGLPVLWACGGLPPALVAYGVSWEFNGPLFEPLWRGLAATGAAPALARGLDALKEWSGDYTSWNRFYPYLYPQLLAKLLLAAVAVAAVVLSWREKDPVAGTGKLFGRLLLCAATVFPWYLLWVLPWAALARHRAWLALSALSFLSYLPESTGAAYFPWIYLAIWIPFFLLLAVERRAWTISRPGA